MRAQPTASHYVNGRYIDDEQGAPLPVIYPATGETIADAAFGDAERRWNSPSRPRAQRSRPGRG